jgi:monovalent cation:H+ antiporter-2, CPA2 family
VLAAASGDVVLLELGGILVGLTLLARLADRVGISPIPLYLLSGVAFGEGGVLPVDVSREFVEIGAEIGVLLLLLTLGLEYTADELRGGLRTGMRAGVVDLALNLPPGVAVGLLLGWPFEAAVVLGGVTYISSSGIAAKLLRDLDRLANRETPTILTTLVLEDLAMAFYLPLVAVLVAGVGIAAGAGVLVVAVGTVALALLAALRFGDVVSRALHTRTDEALVLGLLGVTLVVAGVAERLEVSGAIGAFLVGIAVSGPVQERASALVGPLRDLFAGLFFVFFGFEIHPGDLPPVLGAAALLAVVTGATKFASTSWATRRAGIGRRGRLRAGAALVARGEFSIVLAGIGVAAEPDLGPLAGAYVLMLSIVAPLLARSADQLADAVERWRPSPAR